MNESFCNLSDETVPFSTLAAEIGIQLPDVAEPIINAAIFRASVDFLSKSRVFRTTIDLDFQAYTPDYPIEAPDCNTVLSIEEVRLAGCEIEDFQTKEGWLILPDSAVGQCTGVSFEADVVLGLSKDACELPKEVYERFGQGIINMTLGKLYGMFGEPWYDLNAVRLYGGIGNQSIADAKTLVQLEESKGSVPVVGVEMVL